LMVLITTGVSVAKRDIKRAAGYPAGVKHPTPYPRKRTGRISDLDFCNVE